MSFWDKVKLDLSWYNIRNGVPTVPRGGKGKLLMLTVRQALKSEAFHAVLLFRLCSYFHSKRIKILTFYYSNRLRRRYGSTIAHTADIAGGLRLPHPYGLVIGGKIKIGTMTTIGQHVTLGGNFGKMKDNRSVPVIGDWCFICAGAVVAGPITVGNDVIIGANSTVSKDIPDHAIAGGNPCAVSKIKEITLEDQRNKILHARYFGYPEEFVNSFIR
ncbi:MAG TPA: DapH/DapD/GlmU-related protein [Chitinophaga sp.]|uniref:serine O-acetyltransferase n=1 Tax=Chitinophaga sp. TaxID=1869181 RepID=UPI002CC2F584|nr:DapH/DapD/GlmU-related protein [Chitinophaga sp.]HVI48777.1 DapH/DapD/GlmU-related protein [Chitinophaga sp.]